MTSDRTRVRVENARERAIAALTCLDATKREVVDKLVALACLDYKLRFPEWAKNFRGAIYPWLFHDGDPSTIRISVTRGGTPRSGRVDVYCTFCRVMLVNGAIWNHDYTAQLRPHTTPCALRCLAGAAEPGAPGTYLLPEAL